MPFFAQFWCNGLLHGLRGSATLISSVRSLRNVSIHDFCAGGLSLQTGIHLQSIEARRRRGICGRDNSPGSTFANSIELPSACATLYYL